MKKIISLIVEEFEGGAWVADAVSLDQFDGSFELAGETWTGTMVTERLEFERYHTTIVGGANKLAQVLQDKFYDGSVSLRAALEDICRESGEIFGGAKAGTFLATFERIRMPACEALDAIAAAFDLIWWIGRDGQVQLQADRPAGDEATGRRVSVDTSSVLLREPEDLTLGATYDDATVRHIRWHFTAGVFEARAYFVPFVFREPVQTRYDSLYDAKVDRDNGDGTIDVIAAGRFGVTKVKLFCGVPRSKVKVDPGDLVTLGFFGGDPQKPFAVAMAQHTSATKEVARKGDTIKATLSEADITAIAAMLKVGPGVALGSTVVAVPIATQLSGPCDITQGSERLKVGD